MRLMKHLSLVLLLVLFVTGCAQTKCTRCAALVMDGEFVTSDTATVQDPDGYGPASNLQGPIIENKYFAPFISIMGSHIYHDAFGKRQYVPVAEKFIEDTDRHHQHDWGIDIWPSGGPYKPGVAFFGALVNGEIIAPRWDNIKSVETKILSDSPDSTAISITFSDWKVGEKTVTAVWTLSTHWEARWIKHTFEVPADFEYSLVFGTTKHLNDDDYVEKADSSVLYALATGHIYDYFDPDDRKALVALKAEDDAFEKFYYDDVYAGILVKPSDSGITTTWNMLSWIAEPSPLFLEKDWENKLFQGIK